MIAKALLKAGFGGLVLCKKTDECAAWCSMHAKPAEDSS